MLLAASPRAALALDKQGSAHGGAVEGEQDDSGMGVSGSLMMGMSLINSTYAARPDNTGLALFRYAGHADVDLIGRRLSLPIDVNLFTDRTRKGAAVFVPSELDVIAGVTSTFSLSRALDVEWGARWEQDLPVDRGHYTQSYLDTRARALFSLAEVWPGLAHDLVDGDLSGALTLGWFAYNPTYASRPDNTGSALFRYAAQTEFAVWHRRLALGVNTTFFSDRRDSVLGPTELDLTYEVIGRADPFEAHLAYERDMPVDRSGLVQSFLYFTLAWNFEKKLKPRAH